MTIRAYLFTNMARQINHTYYSLENNKTRAIGSGLIIFYL